MRKEELSGGDGRRARVIEEGRWVIAKLERLSADSAWAHRASGARGGLLRLVEALEAGEGGDEDLKRMDRLIDWGYEMLENAAREMIE